MSRFGGQLVEEQPQQVTQAPTTEPVQAPAPRFGGQPTDEPDFIDDLGEWATTEAKAVKTGMIDPTIAFATKAASDFSDWVTGADVEDYPEIPAVRALTGDFQAADTPIGMMNIIKQQPAFEGKELDLDQDKQGNPLLLIDGQPHYFNKPMPSLNDYDYLVKGVQSVMPLIVGGAAAAPARMATGAAVTGASGFIGEALDQFAAEKAGAKEGYDIEKMGKVGAYTAGGEATGRLLTKVLGGVFGKLFGKKTELNQYFEGGKFTDKGIKLLEKNDVSPETLSAMMRKEMERTGVLTAEQAQRYNKFIDQGMKPTRAQITQTAEDFMQQQQGIKTEAGRAMRGDLDVQNAQLLGRTDELATRAGGNTINQAETGTVLADHITNKALAADARISQIYNDVRATAPQAKNVDLSGMVDTIRKNMGYNTMSKGAASAIWKDLKMRGVLNKEGKLVGKVSVDTAEEIRKVMNMTYGEGNPTAKRLMTTFKDSLDDDVFKAAGGDIYKQARQAKVDFHKQFTDAKTHKLDMRSKNVLEKLYNGEIAPDKAYVRIIKNGPVKDLQRVKQALHSGSPDEIVAGKQAWDNLRSQVIRDATDMATKGGRNEMGDVVFSMKPFSRVIKHYENTGKLRTLFNDAEITELKNLIEVGEMRIPVVGTAIGEGPSSAAIQKFAQMINGRFGMMGPRIATGAVSKGMQFADEAAQAAAMEAARFPAAATTQAIETGARETARAASLPARAGGLGGLMMLGEANAKDQQQRTGVQR